AGGVGHPAVVADPFLTGFVDEGDVRALEHEFAEIAKRGGSVEFERITGDELRRIEPAVSENVGHGIRIAGQSFIDPPLFMHSLAEAVRSRGGEIVTDADVTSVDDDG